MKLRSKIFAWYVVFVTIVVAIVVAAGAVLFHTYLASSGSPTSALWITFAVVVPVIVAASVGGAYVVTNRYFKPLRDLKKNTEKAESLPISNAFPPMLMDDNDEVSETVAYIHRFIWQRHAKLQQVLHFSSLTSHELRTPLTIIRNQLEDGLQSDVTLQYLKDIVASTYDEIIRLHHLINDLLTISTLQAGTLKLEKTDIAFHTFIKDFYDEALLLSREKNLSIVLARGPHVIIQCDPGRMRQVCFNLIDNAIKYTPENGRIYLSYQRINDHLEFKIADTGLGISSSQIGKIFEPFYQASRHEQKVHRGAGLGLSLVQWVVEAHNGTIDVESEEGKGTTFTIRLPLYTNQQE